MSYDIDLKDKAGNYIDFSDVENTNGGMPNVTFNIAGMLMALPCDRPPKWDGKLAYKLVTPISLSILELSINPEKYRKFEAPNGWGTIEGCKNFLINCWNAFVAYPNAIIHTDY